MIVFVALELLQSTPGGQLRHLGSKAYIMSTAGSTTIMSRRRGEGHDAEG